MHLMYFNEQPMAAYDAKEGLKFGATALTIPSSSKRNTEMAEASIHRAESEASPAAVASGRAPKLGG